MSRLRIFDENDPGQPLFASTDAAAVAAELEKIGVTFERWQASKPIEPGATPEQVARAEGSHTGAFLAEVLEGRSLAGRGEERELERKAG